MPVGLIWVWHLGVVAVTEYAMAPGETVLLLRHLSWDYDKNINCVYDLFQNKMNHDHDSGITRTIPALTWMNWDNFDGM